MQRRPWVAAAVWTALTLVLLGIGILMLQACGMTLFGHRVLDFCRAQTAVDLRPPAALLQEQARSDRLQDRLARLQVALAGVEACPLPPPPEEPKPEEPKPEEPRAEAPKPEAPKPEAPKPEAPKPEAPKPETPKPAEPQPPEKACREVPPEERKIDVYLLFDLSGSFADDLPAIRSTVQNLVGLKSSGRIKGQLRLGVGSFIDKPIPPFSERGAYTYRHHLSLTDDLASALRSVRGLSVQEGGDGPEAQLEALLETAGNAGRIGFANDAARLVVLITDAPYHQAGDARHLGPEDGRADGNPTNEDYPSVAQVRSALNAATLTPIFLVAGAQEQAIYRELAGRLGGRVVALDSDSSNLLAALDAGVRQVCGDGLTR